MKSNKIRRKFLAAILACIMVMSFSTSVFAAEPSNENVMSEVNETGISPRAMLWQSESPIVLSGSYTSPSFTIKRGYQISITIWTQGSEVTVKAMQNGSVKASKVVAPGTGTQQFVLLNSSSGGTYSVRFTSNGVATFWAAVNETYQFNP